MVMVEILSVACFQETDECYVLLIRISILSHVYRFVKRVFYHQAGHIARCATTFLHIFGSSHASIKMVCFELC